ncbi:MAG: enoyl-CoA hydratase/isomerase family protein, partial [Quisquiliibacterium sp.]
MDINTPTDIGLSREGHVAIVEIRRPPHNFFDIELIRNLADLFDALDKDDTCRCILLCAQGKAFCAGADFSSRDRSVVPREEQTSNPLYDEAVRLFSCSKPVVAAVQGAAVGGGLGLAMVADFRVASPEARFTANFNRLGFHPGFGLSVTLPRVIGIQQASMLFYTGKRIGGEQAHEIGLVDLLVPQEQLRAEALSLAQEIALSAPIAVLSTRATLRAGLAEA